MCRTYDIPVSAYKYRLSTGHDQEESLTIPKGYGWRCQDHLGNYYKNEKAMAAAYNIPYYTFRARKVAGWTLRDSLMIPVTGGRAGTICKDHLGNEYKSVARMCDHYGITRYTFRSRLSYGWSLEKALTTPVRINSRTNK
jgi:hypothetical protein